ncbi:site-specific integrase [Crossiella cryophila]|uniref:Integrase n=1 Tax=Crossiella cryophila TaxID=43355 RepID=A0A7W7CE23_9PSEU|nr:site-specific integrase [Crossiella cryophila]MBB4679482.1 integrase [Crossiella cryophila]
MTAELEVARLLLAKLGVSAEQLLAEPAAETPMPLLRDYLPRVAGAVSASTREVYGPYWRRMVEVWGDRPLDQVTALEIKQLAEQTTHRAVVRKNSRSGRSAAEHLISAVRCVYRHAVNDELLREWDNPAIRVAKPRRLASTRRALPPARLAEINEVAGSTGNDPELDLTLLRLHTETACRRGGALSLRPKDLDPQQCLIRLREKGETTRWQPVSSTMMNTLVAHGEARGAEPDGPLFRYRNGRPITTRRYDHIWIRVGKHLPWVAIQQVTTHWIRYTTLTFVERNFGYGVARAYAGHFGKGDGGTTTTYIRAELYEVATALAALTGEPHPLAQMPG